MQWLHFNKMAYYMELPKLCDLTELDHGQDQDQEQEQEQDPDPMFEITFTNDKTKPK